MSCHEDRVAAHKHVVKEVFPELTDAQLEGVWALWAYHTTTRTPADRDNAVTGYLTVECGVPHVDEAKKAVRALHQFDLCLF